MTSTISYPKQMQRLLQVALACFIISSANAEFTVTNSITCDFESDMCDWSQQQGYPTYCNWSRTQISTSLPTTNAPSGQYAMVLENLSDNACLSRLISGPFMSTNKVSMNMSYFLSDDSASLRIYNTKLGDFRYELLDQMWYTGEPIWSTSLASFTPERPTEYYFFIIEGYLLSKGSKAAIDNIIYVNGTQLSFVEKYFKRIQS